MKEFLIFTVVVVALHLFEKGSCLLFGVILKLDCRSCCTVLVYLTVFVLFAER